MITFNACKFLDFSGRYTAEKKSIMLGGTVKVCWNRPVIDASYPSLVQFCQLRGRLDYPDACLSEDKAICIDYIDHQHSVDFVMNGVGNNVGAIDNTHIGVIANEIELAVLADLTDRKGLRQAWEGIDEKIQAEIEDKWIELIEKKLKFWLKEGEER